MKLDDLIATTQVPTSGDEMLSVLQTMLEAEDLTADDRGGVATGFLIGVTYALAKHNENGGDVTEVAHTLLRMKNEWEASGVL